MDHSGIEYQPSIEESMQQTRDVVGKFDSFTLQDPNDTSQNLGQPIFIEDSHSQSQQMSNSKKQATTVADALVNLTPQENYFQ